MIDGLRQVNLRVSTVERLNKVKADKQLASLNAAVNWALNNAGVE